MYRNILEQMRECVGQRRVVIPTHAFVAMTQDLFLPEDIYHCILEGAIVERQGDRKYGEYKYVIDGEAEDQQFPVWITVLFSADYKLPCSDSHMIAFGKTVKTLRFLKVSARHGKFPQFVMCAKQLQLLDIFQTGNCWQRMEARCNWLPRFIKSPVIPTSSRFTACIDMITKTKTRKAKVRLDQTSRSICVHCGEEAARSVTLPQAYQQGKDLILIENVPMKLCESCGQSYLEGVTLDEIGKVLKAPAQYTEPQWIKVARLP